MRRTIISLRKRQNADFQAVVDVDGVGPARRQGIIQRRQSMYGVASRRKTSKTMTETGVYLYTEHAHVTETEWT